MNDATRRGLRTAGQLVLTLLTNGALFGLLDALGVNVSVEAYAAVSAVLLPIVTVLVNALEDRETIPALFAAKAPLPGTAAPHTPTGVDGDTYSGSSKTAATYHGSGEAGDLGESLSQRPEDGTATPGERHG